MSQMNDEDYFIFNRMVEGDKNAFRFFFEKYYTDLCNLVNFYLHDSVKSEDIVQDIYIYFWEKKEKIKIESSVKSYLLRASKNKSLNYLRNERTKLNIHEKLSKVPESGYELQENLTDLNHFRKIIEKAMDSLPKKCREIYILGKERNLSYNEIACKLDISAKTVENQMSNALKRLRAFFKPYYNDFFI